ncbi:LADA_0F04390g1_1 [Lachancea dasiensis]|uniref:LADA_0F04390g1_1 n=1 Tax=Lachancea dasiensis TaxID=1072105 RepID=A0A1G4JJ58_9SACH|nr:LADA_0F04390g1_1 [Lachancea dasiensis]
MSSSQYTCSDFTPRASATVADNASVNSFGSSIRDLGPRSGLDPRARSTSDLFEVPNQRIRPKPYKRSSTPAIAAQRNHPNLSLIPEQQHIQPQLMHSLTPYQKQRRRMKNSFQFPNGESFTPKQKSTKSFDLKPDAGRFENPRQHKPGHLPKSVSCSNFRSAAPRADFASPARVPMSESRSGSFSNALSPSGHLPPYNRFHKSASMSRIAPLSQQVRQPPSMPQTFAGKNRSITSLQSVPSHLTCDFNNNSIPKTQAVSSNNSSTNSSNSLKSENVVSSNTSTDASEPPLKSMTPLKGNVAYSLYAHAPKTSSSLHNSSMPKRESVALNSPKKGDSTPKETPKPSSSKGVKRSASYRIGAFFKKFLPFKKSATSNPDAKFKPVPHTKPLPKTSKEASFATPKISVSRPSLSSSYVNKLTIADEELGTRGKAVAHKSHLEGPEIDDANDGDNEGDDEDDEDDQLLDIDLVFDSLLLKNDHPVPKPLSYINAIEKASMTEGSDFQGVEQKNEEFVDNNVDYQLVQEFSRLGNFITDETSERRRSGAVSPPPRSLKRPLFASKASVAGFYRQSGERVDKISLDLRLDHSLKKDWEFIHYDAVISASLSEDKAAVKKLRFGHAIYVKDTYASQEYERSDKKFIRGRRRMMQTQNMAFIDAVKSQLNEFKKSEMKVHGDSVQNTHYFL